MHFIRRLEAKKWISSTDRLQISAFRPSAGGGKVHFVYRPVADKCISSVGWWQESLNPILSPLNGSIQHNPFCHLGMPQSSAIKSVAFDHIASVQVAMLMVLAMAVMVLAMAVVLEIWRR